jgi:hypothetical protein
MKKYLIAIFATVLAITFSSFRSGTTRTQDEFYFQDTNGWHAIDASAVCPEGSTIVCQIDNPETPTIPNDLVTVYKSMSATSGNELKYNE